MVFLDFALSFVLIIAAFLVMSVAALAIGLWLIVLEKVEELGYKFYTRKHPDKKKGQ